MLCCVVCTAYALRCAYTMVSMCTVVFFYCQLFEFFLLFYRVYVCIEICVSVCVPFFLFSRVLTVNGLRSILINGAPNTIFLFEHCANVILTPFVESDCRTVLCIGRQAYSIRCVCISFSLLVACSFSLTLLMGLCISYLLTILRFVCLAVTFAPYVFLNYSRVKGPKRN